MQQTCNLAEYRLKKVRFRFEHCIKMNEILVISNIYMFFACPFSILVHSQEENHVLQHARTDGPEETRRHTSQPDGEEEKHVTSARRIHQKIPLLLEECR